MKIIKKISTCLILLAANINLLIASPMTNDYDLTSDNFNIIYDDRFGNYHLLENIDLGGEQIAPIGTMAEPFEGNIYGNGFTIENFTVRAGDGEAQDGLFSVLGDNVEINGLSLNNAIITGNKVGILAGVTGDGCTISIDRLSNIAVSALSGISGFLIGETGDNNTVSLGYSTHSRSYGIHGNGPTGGLVGRSGNNNVLSVGLGQSQVVITPSGQIAGVVAEAGSNTRVINSVVLSPLIHRADNSDAIGPASDGIECINSFWSSSSTGAPQSGCAATGYTDQELKQLSRSSDGLTTETSAFRFGDNAQWPMALEFGNRLAELDDPICSEAACRPNRCDSRQGSSSIQVYDSDSSYYIVSVEQRQGNNNLSFRVYHLIGGRLDTSFGDSGMIRYFALESDTLTHFELSDTAVIYRNRVVLSGMSNNQIAIVAFFIGNSLHRERRYRLYRPTSVSGAPVWLGNPGQPLSGDLLYLITLRIATLGIFRIYRLGTTSQPNNFNSAAGLQSRNVHPSAASVQSVVVESVNHIFFTLVSNTQSLTSIVRISLISGDPETYDIEWSIDDPVHTHLYLRDSGLWLIQSNIEGDYSADLLDFNQSPGSNNSFIFAFNGTGADASGLLLPDNGERPELHLASFDGDCLQFETFQTTVITPPKGIFDQYVGAVSMLLNSILFIFGELAVLFTDLRDFINPDFNSTTVE